MHILVVFTYNYSIDTWSKSGTFKKEIEPYKLLAEKGMTFTFLTFGTNDSNIDYLRKYNINVIQIYEKIKLSRYSLINYLKSFLIPFVLKKDLKNVDVIKQNQLLGSWISIILKYLLKKPLFIRTGYDMYEFSIKENKKWRIKSLYKMLTFFSLYFADIYSVSSKSDKIFLEKHFKNLSSKVIVRPNWVKEIKTGNFDERYENKIICVGRLENQKNLHFLIASFSNTSYVIDIVGSGTLKNELKNYAIEKKTKINFLGKLTNEEIIEMLPKYKYYITTSKYEGNPKSTLEALSCGCIVIASDIQNHKELITQGYNGFLYLNIENNLLNTFKNIVANESLKNISENAKNIVKTNSLDLTVQKEFEDIKSL
jgi:glycosyltransferase involved in cell wall biosynthesis